MEQPTAPVGKRSYYSAKESEKAENPRSGLERWRPTFEIEVKEEAGDVYEMELQEKQKWKVRQRRGWDGEGVGPGPGLGAG